MQNVNPEKPTMALLAKLGSIVIHSEEFISDGSHPFDVAALRELLADEEVQKWLDSLAGMALIPVKRR